MGRGIGTRIGSVAAAAALAVAVALPVRAQPPAGQPKKPTGNIVVKLTMEDGKSFKEGSVFLKEKRVELKKDQKALSFLDVPVGTYAPTAEIFVKQGWFKPKRRYLGVVPVRVIADKSIEADIVVRPVEDIDALCSVCHPGTGEISTGAGGVVIPRDIHVSGRELGPKFREQVDAFNKRIEKAVKDGVPHSYPIKLEKRGDKIYYTCESCHTPHFATPHTNYVIANFKEKSTLCRGCHY